MERYPLHEAIGDAMGSVIPEDAGPFVIGDYVVVAEATSADHVGFSLVAEEMTPRHLALLAEGIKKAEAWLSGVRDSDWGTEPDEP